MATACGSRQTPNAPAGHAPIRIRYGHAAEQFAELSLPAGSPREVIALVHGGYWLPQYTLELMRPMARDLQSRGHAVWNIEYRRLETGGGWPATFTDMAAAMDRLATLPMTRHLPVKLVGHSAGGPLAVWAASRDPRAPGGRAARTPESVVSLAGVLDLSLGALQNLGGGVIPALIGDLPNKVPGRYDLVDPTRLVPAHAPVLVVRGTYDVTVPASQGAAYLAAARRAGGLVSALEVRTDHLGLIDVATPAWHAVRRRLETGIR